MLYGYVKFFGLDLGYIRLSGTGLANMLFPWARLIVAAKKYGLLLVAPTWLQIKLGPFLRKEKDKRIYSDIFNTDPGQIRGIKKLLLINSLPALNEKELYNGSIKDDGSDRVVIFEGKEGYFERLLRDHVFVKQEILKITKEKHKKGLDFDFSGSISVHIRLGDFLIARDKKVLGPGFSNVPIPISWYVDVVTRIRALAGSDLPVYLFSDGTDEQLAEMRRMPNTQRVFFGSSIADMIALSRAHILVASGSTFSQWASYLGRMPVIWYRGHMVQKLYSDKKASWEIECLEGESFSADFSSLIKKRCFPDNNLCN